MNRPGADELTVARPPATGDDALADAVILVVDDQAQNRLLFERILLHAGAARVHGTGDPTQVVALLAELRPDLVLLDLHMPRMDGFAVLRALAEVTTDHDFVPVIVLTADATTDARDRALAAGANDFLTKPVDRPEVVLRARNLLHTRRLHTRLASQNVALRSEVDERRAVEAHAQQEQATRRRRVEEVIDRGGPRMVFQPMVDLASGAFVGYEALARFDHQPPRPPDVWFAEAAAAGIGDELELAAVRAAVDRVDDLPAGAYLSINLSPSAATSPRLGDALEGIEPSRLVLEVTEHAQVGDYDELLSAIGPWRARGVRLAVDDAGAGYASLHHILRLRPEIIKLDIALVHGIEDDPVKRALACALVAFSHEIGADITAEGVETAEERSALLDIGVPFGQGYLFARPGELPRGR